MRMRKKLISSFVLTVIVPILAISIMSITRTKQESLTRFTASSDSEIRQVENTFVLFFEQMKNNARFLAQSQAVVNVSDDTSTYFGAEKMMTPETSGDNEAEIFRLFESFGVTHPELLFVYLGTAQGGFIQYPAEPLGGYDPRKRPWYQEISQASDKVVITEPYQGVTGQAMVSVATAIKRDSALVGVQSLDVTLATLTDIVSSIQLGDTGYLMLLDGNGTILADPKNPDSNFKNVADLSSPKYQVIKNMSSAHKDALVAIEDAEKQMMAKSYYSKTLNWTFVALMDEDEILSSAYAMSYNISVIALIMLVLFIVIAIVLANKIVYPIEMVSEGLKEIAQGEGNLSKRLQIIGNDEISELASWFNQFLNSINALVIDIKNNASNLNEQAQQSHGSIDEIRGQCHHQASTSQQTAEHTHAMENMAMTVNDNCTQALSEISNTDSHAQQGNELIQSTVKQVATLNDSLGSSAQAMSELEDQSNNITNILEVIRTIAEQTNLLALNAAIEAARAGEQGRGFAVVADEVRTLAQRSHDATKDIEKVLTKLTEKTRAVSKHMTLSVEESKSAIEQSEQAHQAFEEIADSISRVKPIIANISQQAEQQGAYSSDSRTQIEGVNQSIKQVSQSADTLYDGAKQLVIFANNLNELVGRFNTD
ncbi:methyl-accepting chemotaxis protein [Pseudoalteromonas luteoviolacea]|uniref:methyl-accepting chemotaxis protein n=1 Tax=Pseudoalteromonas luteoviolacea TaxID=43657 RepID=UPI001B361CE2|nr:methyl-accepting chemotaxis protein [Pseudoalteromonas luteoviolacea]MBQ4837800.1 methyl-accepting chemotaxis protein [Pseudoalteromonas luteoviolacea]